MPKARSRDAILVEAECGGRRNGILKSKCIVLFDTPTDPVYFDATRSEVNTPPASFLSTAVS